MSRAGNLLAARNLALAALPCPGTPEQHRVAGAHRDTVYGFGADLAEDRGSVVVPPDAGPRQDQHQVSYGRGAPNRSRDRGRVIGLYLADRRPGASLGRARASMTELLSTMSPGPSGVPTGRTSSPVGMIATTGCLVTSRVV